APILRRSSLIHAFRSIEGFQEFTLRQGGTYLCYNTGFDLERLLESGASEDSGSGYAIRYRMARVAGADYLIAHAGYQAGPERYELSFARDISAVTGSIRALAVRCLAAGLLVATGSAAAMWLLVYRSLRPIERLRAGAAELAHGQYETRIAIAGRDELAALAADFNAMADAIEANIGALHETSVRQQSFINDLSHELKTPVTSILLNAETLLKRNVPPETRNRSLARIYDQGRWLETLSQKLMTLVLLQGEIAMQEESVPALLDAVRTATMDALHEQGMALATECSMDTLPMDTDLMRAALTNLVANAAKASRAGQSIAIRAHGRTIGVIDHGSGIPQEEIARVTEPFYRVDRSRSKRNG
ncbi:MAG: HAMP domain-containing sensor histidine kinase, partial [Clostridia bacterium]|nr:HAMP domain-containing sensor histidine kinase [Clostridia bacterium]